MQTGIWTMFTVMLLMTLRNQYVQEENYHSPPSKYFKADAEHSDMALLETDGSIAACIVCIPASKQPLTFNFHELSAELIQQLSTSEKIPEKAKLHFEKPMNMTKLVMKRLIVMIHRLPQQKKMKKIHQTLMIWLVVIQQKWSKSFNHDYKEHVAIVLGYSVCHNCTGKVISELLKLINIHVYIYLRTVTHLIQQTH